MTGARNGGGGRGRPIGRGTLAVPTGEGISGDRESPFPGWEPFIPKFVHPLKVAIVEALLYIEPLSAVQFRKVFGSDQGFRESNVRYHLNHLAEVGVLEIDPFGYRRDGDPKQKYFYFARLQTEPS
jgi:hypothetical protein